MVEPLFRAENLNGVTAGALFVLTGAEAKHAASVRRMRVGERIQLSDGSGLRARGAITDVQAAQLQIQIDDVVHEAKPAIELHLAQALAKGDRDELAIQAATELGVFGILPWQADRSVSRWEGPKIAKGVDRWQAIVNEAAKQSLRVFEPEVRSPLSSKQLSAVVSEFDSVLVLDPTASVGLASTSLPVVGKVLLVVGPEGGISDAELQLLESAGAIRVNLGSPILRTSTAGVAAIAAILALSGAWN